MPQAAGMDPKDYAVKSLKDGKLRMSCEDPDNPANFPRNLFVWRSNLLGSSGKGHEYFLKHLLGTTHGVQGKDLGTFGGAKPEEVNWRAEAPEGKLDLLVTLDFRMSTTCLYSDIVLPTATWYEKNDLNTSDMHPFIHPLSAAVDPAWEARNDWEIYKGFAKKFSEVCVGHLGVEKELVLTPLMHDTPGELAQALDVKEWKKGECELVPGKTAPAMTVIERDYPNTYKKFTALGPLMAKVGNGGKGIAWNTEHEVQQLGELNYAVTDEGITKGMPRIETDIDASEVILMLAPETNGEVAVKAWEALSKITGREHAHLARAKEDEKLRFRDLQAQPRKIISSPTWSGIESEKVSYNAGWTNINELIPWRTLTGRQQFYQDHKWMLGFGEGLCVYRPPVDLKTTRSMRGVRGNGNPEVMLNFITPHQKWGIHSTYTDNLLMLTLSRGGPIVWLSEDDARKAGIVDNDWIELFNVNGAIAARAVVSQRVLPGMCMMYHAQEKIINTPGSEITGTRGGIHNSVTRIVTKPTHMIGGYAQLSYGFNYYGTIGTNRDEFVVVRKMKKVDWLDEPAAAATRRSCIMKVRAQIGMVLNLDKCIGCHTCSVTCKNVWTNREGMEYAWFNNVETKPGIGYPKQWENQEKWNGGWVRKDSGKIQPKQGGKLEVLLEDIRQSQPAADRRLLRTVHLRLPAPAQCAGNEGAADRAPALAPDRGAHGENRRRAELGGNPRRGIRQALQGLEFRGHAEGDVRPVRKHLHDVSAAPVRALPQSDLRRVLPVGLDLQARGRRHRPHRPGQMPRLAHVRVGLPVQEDLLQLVHRQGGEVHILLSAHRVGTADGVLGNLRRAHPLPRGDALRCRPHSRGGERGEREGPVQGAARAVPRPARGRSSGAGARRRRARGLDPGGAAVARVQDGDGVEGGAAAASGIPHAADGLVRAAAVADQRCRQCGTARRLRRSCPTCAACASRCNTSPICSPQATRRR